MAVVLTQNQLQFLASTYAWKFDLGIRDARNYNDSVVYTGEGVEDLDSLIARLEGLNSVPTSYILSVDVGSLFSDYVKVTLDDVYALKQTYISTFGNVNRPGIPFNVGLSQSTREIEPYISTGTVVTGVATQLSEEDPGLAAPLPPGLQLHEEFEDYGDGRANQVPPPLPGQELL